MGLEKEALWIIAGSKGPLNDGQLYTKRFTSRNKEHRDLCVLFWNEYLSESEFPKDVYTHHGWANYFVDQEMALFLSSGHSVDGKYFGTWFLPESMSLLQATSMEQYEALFREHYFSNVGMFDSRVRTYYALSYRMDIPGFRNLFYESQIEGKPLHNGIDLLYREVDKMKKKQKIMK